MENRFGMIEIFNDASLEEKINIFKLLALNNIFIIDSFNNLDSFYSNSKVYKLYWEKFPIYREGEFIKTYKIKIVKFEHGDIKGNIYYLENKFLGFAPYEE